VTTAVAAPEELTPLIDSFKQDGYVVFEGAYTPEQVARLHELREEIAQEWQYVEGTEAFPDAVGSMLERRPQVILPALTHPVMLGFAEAVMGPLVQLDSAVLASDPPMDDAGQFNQPVMWHRDRFASVPPDVYVRPISMVYLGYMQSMTDDVGALRVLPGSHRQSRTLDDSQVYAPVDDEVLVRAEPGDVVAIHHNLLHWGGRNTSDGERRFFGFIYNISMLGQEDNFRGPNCRALVEVARRTNDRRMLRLLGEDPLIFPRQNSGFTHALELDWARWLEEDAEYARATTDEAATVSGLRLKLAGR
jgi:ectoine hydroxylase-related dioxygenase (phytanoyl-CoA dioxygenase family)